LGGMIVSGRAQRDVYEKRERNGLVDKMSDLAIATFPI
jgi:hypothetical protein